MIYDVQGGEPFAKRGRVGWTGRKGKSKAVGKRLAHPDFAAIKLGKATRWDTDIIL